MNGRDWAQLALIIAMAIVIITVIVAIGGCALSKDDKLDEGMFVVDADCEKNRVRVELDLDRTDSDKSIQVTK